MSFASKKFELYKKDQLNEIARLKSICFTKSSITTLDTYPGTYYYEECKTDNFSFSGKDKSS